MKELFLQMIQASLGGSLIILVVLLLRIVLKKSHKSFICVLWLLAGIKLLCPWSIESAMSLQPDYSAAMPEIQIQTGNDPIVEEVPPVQTAPDVVIPEKPQAAAVDLTEILAWVWAAGTLALGIYHGVTYFRLKRRMRMITPNESGYFESAAVDTPFLLGFIRPRIYLPAGLPEKDKNMILLHEKAHLARRDHWCKLAGVAVLCVHWFNPLVWAAYFLLCKDIEMACDERVIKNMNMEQRKVYTGALVACSVEKRRTIACAVTFAEADARKRILHVLRYRRPKAWLAGTSAVIAVLVVLCFLTDPLASGEEALPEDNSTPSVEQTESPQPSDEPLNTPEPEPSEEVQNPEPEVLPTPLPGITKPVTEPEVSEEVHVHAYSVWTKEPTCTENGYDYHQCECGHYYTDNYTSAGHTYYVDSESEPISTTRLMWIGSRHLICTNCGAETRQYFGDSGEYDLNEIIACGRNYAASLGFGQDYSAQMPAGALFNTSELYASTDNRGGQSHLENRICWLVDEAHKQVVAAGRAPGEYELWINVWIYTNGGMGICSFALEVCMHEA